MKKLFYLFCAGALLFSGGCSDDGAWNAPRIAFADIVDAESLYLTGTSATRASDEESPSDLFKVTFDGSTEKVVFTDENGSPVDVKVESFRRISDNFIFFSGIVASRHSSNILIQRSDGATFEVPWEYAWTFMEPETTVQTDYNGNVYLGTNNYPGSISKIYTHGNEVYGTQINRDDMEVYPADWLVDRRGNVLINYEYLRLVSGEFARHPGYYGEEYFYAWNDSEGFYGWDVEKKGSVYSGYEIFLNIKYCRPTSPTSTFEVIKTFEFDYYNPSFTPLVYTDKTVLFEIGGKYRVDIYDKNHIELHEMEPHVLPDGIRFEYYGQKYPHTERYLYGKSESEIWRLSVETGVPEMLYKYDDEFVIKSMTVRNDIVTFTAFELRRGNDVVAEIYPDKTVKVLESTNGDKIIYFERLN